MEGLILIDKPAGITSHDVVDRIRDITHIKRVGHAGTLDPFATGLLIIGVNKGTKLLTGLVGLDKTYHAVARLGGTSTTDDPEGTITDIAVAAHPHRDDIERAMDAFRGGYEQTAPLFSAKRINGKKLYELARAGKADAVERPKKLVTISELEILDYTWPDLSFRVSCSTGTYVRAIARDLGEHLGCGGYLTMLRRTRIGAYSVDDAITLDHLTFETFAAHLLHP